MKRHRCAATPIRLAVLSAVLAACTANEDRSASEWVAEHDTIGDTIVVRTVGGSVWSDTAILVADLTIGQFEGPDEYMFGRLRSLAVASDGSIYVFDSHARALRKYAPDGSYLGTFGQEGSGPGEYKRPDAGLAVLPDGRVLLRDPGNARITVYSPDGEYLDSWRIRGGLNTSRRLSVDTAGNVYVFLLINQGAPVTEWQRGLARYGPDGVPGDTLRPPSWDFEEPELVASVNDGENRSMSVSTVPFGPEQMWSFSPLGYMVGALSTRYAIDLYQAPDRVLRIERADWQPVPVLEPEKEEQEAIMTANMRFTEPGWRWNGPPIPDTKPPFSRIYAGDRGRVWVRLHQEAYQIESEEVDEPEEPGTVPDRTWIEPVAFDVFEADGRYLGMVRAPEGFSIYPTPVFRGDTVWAVVRGEFDVPYLVRFKIEHRNPDET
ncbi:MAG: hypothetical protein GWN99_04860 [Gemmatimonadetes bacterium]|uniref:6-bladed beta-propeller n=1 Tax=Candidatus Kutchimonas denitrificans TaxID=3056748 RepID=A0AAE4ZCD5_9BACT|nr:hypothetical protein [Gemmatimonadota bacterium]NIR75881.1 hypothetical protein [Candidatus Kutchimonas denitrificans]NIS00393.1 hypothetical protein [Gemmatimonadota bacterium]NIT66057.1 hypothetical protein [Gemmatimonadota bacterium]NIU54811.1 hypothetical protein [Gemmatimonadota bacterium]